MPIRYVEVVMGKINFAIDWVLCFLMLILVTIGLVGMIALYVCLSVWVWTLIPATWPEWAVWTARVASEFPIVLAAVSYKMTKDMQR